MGDLFGCWISDLIIELVFAEIQRAKHHKYLFLTKNPARYLELPGTYFSKNLWFGTTVTGFQDCHRIKSLQDLPEYVNKFVSFEPLLNDCGTPDLNGIGWVIIGAQTNPFYPVMWKWLNGICYAAGNTPVFFKNNLKDWMTGSMMFRQDYPTELTR
jgi:protein gp37